MTKQLRGPTEQQRVIILGRTGSGKSQFAISLLATRDWGQGGKPWIIIDYKGEDLLLDIMKANPGAIQEIKVTDSPPKRPGLYYMHPTPKVDDNAMEVFLWKVWKNGNTGLFIDEGYMLPERDAFDALLTQGRTLHIPIICLYQRPAWMSRFAVAQSDFRIVFALDDQRDEKTASQFVKPAITEEGTFSVYDDLTRYSCLYYDVSQGVSFVLPPAPDRQAIIDAFSKRLAPRRKREFV